MATERALYTHGHHASVVKDHARRTANDSAAFLLPYIKSHHRILDVGCGPGTITADFAQLVPEGEVIGADAVESVLKQASEFASSRNLSNIKFQKVDANALPFKDEEFDIVFCHQVLQHVKDPVGILKEMRRVAKKGGIVAAREADYKTFIWLPESSTLDKWQALYQKTARANGGEPNAGRYCESWARQAGFKSEDITFTFTSWVYAGERAKAFCESWAGRTMQPGYTETVIKNGFATKEELQEISDGWRAWGKEEGAFVAIPSGEILCRRS